LHDRAVVELSEFCCRLVAGAGGVGSVQALAQRTAEGKLHDWQIAGHFQRELVAFFAVSHCGGTCGLNHVRWHTHQFFFGGKVGKGIGGVQRVLTEFLTQLGLAFL